jgi:hypothetical protein
MKTKWARKRRIIKLQNILYYPWPLLSYGFWAWLAFVRGVQCKYYLWQGHRLEAETASLKNRADALEKIALILEKKLDNKNPNPGEGNHTNL